MDKPLDIRFRNMEPSEALETKIRGRVAKLEQLYPRISSCRVVVEKQHRSHQKGNMFDIHIVVHMPGREIAVSRDHGVNPAHEDVYVAVRDAFDAAKRQMEHMFHGQRGEDAA